MAKPIIVTNISDIPEILDGCSWIVEPEKPEQSAGTVQYAFDHSVEVNARQTDVKESD